MGKAVNKTQPSMMSVATEKGETNIESQIINGKH